MIEKKPLREIANGAAAINIARSNPIPQPARQSMDFIRSLVLDIPIQVTHVDTVSKIDPIIEESPKDNISWIKRLSGIN
jgi:hypothetical protein